MNTIAEKFFVERIANNRIIILCRDCFAAQRIRQLGGRRVLFSMTRWKLNYVDETDLATKLSVLRDAKVAMVGGSAGWHPAAIFEQLRDKGFIAGKYLEIVWTNPNSFIISEK